MAFALYEEGLLEKNRLCLVESESDKQNDRTWCYWAPAPLSPISMVSKAWATVHHPTNPSRRENLWPYSYFHVRSADFYAGIRQHLKACSNITWLIATVSSVEEQPDRVLVKTAGGWWWSNRVFTSVSFPVNGAEKTTAPLPWRPHHHPLFLWQSFVGWRVEATSPVFDDTCATMMRFDIAQHNQTQFMYELPFSATEALVEMTRFGEHRLEPDEAEAELRAYLQKKGAQYQIIEKETGAIPMTPQFDARQRQLNAHTRIVYIGTTGGAIKPTTGYAFKRMQTYGRAVASALRNQQALPTMHRPWRFRMYDQLLLRILWQQPHRGKAIFERLFDTQPVPLVLRFMDEETTLWEEVLIFSRLPIRLFLRTLFHHCIGS
jgi:lycopene beta-cyclase